MAKIISEDVTLTFSQIVKSGDNEEQVPTAVTEDILNTLLSVAQELVDKSIVVEINN